MLNKGLFTYETRHGLLALGVPDQWRLARRALVFELPLRPTCVEANCGGLVARHPDAEDD